MQLTPTFEALGRRTPEERAGLFVWPGLAGSVLTSAEEALLARFRPSGVVLFRRNMPDLMRAAALVAAIRRFSPGCVVAIDEEGGRVARLPWPVPRGLTALQLGDARSLERAREQALLQGYVSRGLGIDCVLAPVADILTREDNPALDERCYGREPELVARFVVDVSGAYRDAGVTPCVKHFPGHGDTVTDTHLDFAETSASRDTLRAREWLPFRRAFDAGVRLCMTGHVKVPSIDPSLPATLSPVLLKHVLRDELGFDGLVLSDDLRMRAVALQYGVQTHVKSADAVADVDGLTGKATSGYLDRAGVDALRAGCDVLLSCQSIVLEVEVLEGVARALASDAAFAREMESRMRYFATALPGGLERLSVGP